MKKTLSKIIIASLFFVLVVSLAARFCDLTMDPFRYDEYGVSWVDEGSWIHNARNKVLFGEYETQGELWNPMYISPIFNYMELISFSNLGVNTFTSRIAPAIIGILSVLIAGFLIMQKRRREGIIYMVLLGINTMYIAYSRAAVPETTALFFIILVLGLVAYDSKHSWLIAGFFLPFLFFSKTTTIFLMISLPLSLILYYAMYRSKYDMKNFLYLCVGGAISSVIWLFWLVPVFGKWLFMNFGLFDQRIYVNLFKLAGTSLYTLKFLLLNVVASVIAGISIYFIVSSFITSVKTKFNVKKDRKKGAKKEMKSGSIRFMDFFLVLSLLLFLCQAVVFDFPLRRFVLTLPVLLLIAARFLSNLDGFSFRISSNNRTVNISRNAAVYMILAIYVLTNLVPIGFYFSELSVRGDYAHTFVRNSREIGGLLPKQANVYGNLASSLRLENDIHPFIAYNAVRLNDSEKIAAYFDKYKIDYAIFKIDLSNKEDMKLDEMNLEDSGVADYIMGNFELMAKLNSKDHWNNNLDRKIYIYKRIQAE